jgi:quercetin 2,3-dioxygenase
MKVQVQRSEERGHNSFGWLDSHHSFSFGHFYDPDKINFGALRVLNDDIVLGGEGFGTHPHDNMEIVSIPLKGALAHKDSTGTDGIIQTGDVQIMSAGTGIRHSEYNASKTELVNFLQIWVIPEEPNIRPRYEQKAFSEEDRINNWQVVVSPDGTNGALWINQNCVFSRLTLQSGKSITYNNRFPGNGVYLFVLEGSIIVSGDTLKRRDAAGITGEDSFELKADEDSEVLAIEVPVKGY